MANLIQIKRSINTAVPGSLANGELAYTANGDVLYIGSEGAVEAIGGKRVPGVLTANQAIVANSTSGVDRIITSNAIISAITANGSLGGAGQVLKSNSTGIYWTDVATNLQDLLDTEITSPADASLLLYDTATSKWRDAAMSGDATINDTGVITFASTGVVASSYGDANTVATFTVDGKGRLTAAGSADINHDTLLNFVADEHVAHSGVDLTAGSGLTGGGDITTSRTFNVGAGNGVTVNTDDVAVNAQDGLLANSSGLYVVGSSTIIANSSGVHVNPVLSITDLTLSGNLDINGTLTTIDTENLSISDSIIELARGNAADTLDIGFYGAYNNGADRYTGLIWDTSSDVFELFANTTVQPTTTLDTTGTGYATATLKAFLQSSALVSNSSVTNITANSSVSVAIVANTLTLSTALAGTSGGTGKSTMTSQALLVGNTTNGYGELALGTTGQILQSNGSALVYDSLDGGTF